MSDRRALMMLSNPTAGYQPSGHLGLQAAMYASQGEAWFTWGQVPFMVRDNAVSFGLKALRSPYAKVEIAKDEKSGELKIAAKDSNVRRYIARTWATFWNNSLPQLLDHYFTWGQVAGGAEWVYKRTSRRLVLERVRLIQGFDATPYRFRDGRKRGKFAGYTLSTNARETRWVGPSHAFFFAGFEKAGSLCDYPAIATAFSPWLDKTSPQGLRAARRIQNYTRAVGVTVVRYPPGKKPLADGSSIDNENLAVQTGFSVMNGTVVALPSDRIAGEPGKTAWDIEQRQSTGDGAKINESIRDADEEIWFGMGIPPEIIRAGGAAGSGYSGRAIPMEVWLSAADELAGMVDNTFREQVLHYGVKANFGKQDFDYELVSLLKEYLKAGQPAAGMQATPGGGAADGAQRPGGGSEWTDAGFTAGGHQRQTNAAGQKRYLSASGRVPAYLSDLAGEDDAAATAEQLKAVRYAMYVAAELGAVHGHDAQDQLDALADLIHDPEHLTQLLSSADLSWVPYHGPRGGVGAKSDTSGRVIYGRRAQAALEAQARRGQRQASADRARELTDAAHKGEARPEHFEELATHLPALTAAELRDARRKLRATFGNGKRRDQMVSALLAHTSAVAKGEEPPKRKAPERGPAQREDGTPKEPAAGRVYDVPTESLKVDPERFQFKLNTDPKGVTQELKSVKTFNPEFAGVLAVWRDPESGMDHVVNGHHRHELAERTGHPSLPVRYIEAKTAKEARAVGALINMAEGRGTAVDAAKFMRDSGVGADELENRGVSLHGRLAEDATALTTLSDKTFDRIARGDLDTGKALAVAKNLPKPELQDQLFRLLDKREEAGKDLPLRVIEEMAREMGETPTHTTTESTLFGDIEEEESLFVPRNELKAAVRADLARELGDFSAVASTRRAGRVGEAGNVLNLEENKKRAAEAAESKWAFDQLANRSGAISTALNEGAAEYAKAKTKGARDGVRKQVTERVREAIRGELAGLRPVDAGTVGGGDEGGVAAPDGEREGPADQGTPDAGTGDAVGAGVDKHPRDMTREEFEKMTPAYHVTAAADAIRREGFKTAQGGGVGGDSSKVYTSDDRKYSEKLAGHLNAVKSLLNSTDDPVPDAMEYARIPYEEVLPGGLVRRQIDRYAQKLGRELTPKEEAAVIAFSGPLMAHPETPPRFGDDLERFMRSPDFQVLNVRGRNPVSQGPGMGGEKGFKPGDVFVDDYEHHKGGKAADPAAHLDTLKAAGMQPGEWYDRDAVVDHLDDDKDPKTGVANGIHKLAQLHEAGHVEIDGGRVRLSEPDPKAGGPAADAPTGPAVGDRVTVPRSHTAGEFEATVTDEGGGLVGLKTDKGIDALKMPAEHLPQFLADLRGEVRGSPTTESESLNTILKGGGKFLGRGNDGLAFDAGDGNVVKASSILPFHWNNGTRSVDEGNRRIVRQVETNQAMKAAGVPGLVDQQLIHHEGRAFAVMPKVDTEAKLSAEQLEKVADSVRAAHAAGFTFGDDIQVGTDAKGEPAIFDTGAARQLGTGRDRDHDIEEDESRLSWLFQQHGQEFHGIDPAGKYAKAVGDARRALARPNLPANVRDMYRRKLDRLHAEHAKANPDAADLWANDEHAKNIRELFGEPDAPHGEQPAGGESEAKPAPTRESVAAVMRSIDPDGEFVSLADLRDRLGGTREEQDAVIQQMRRDRVLRVHSMEGGMRGEPGEAERYERERAAGIPEEDEILSRVSLTKPAPKPAGADVQRDLLGRPIAKRFGGGGANVQPTIEDAMREAWTQRAKEFAATAGQPITEYSASGRFKMGGEWYEVGPAEDGHPIRKVS